MIIKIAIGSKAAFLAKSESLVKSFTNRPNAQFHLDTVRHFADMAHAEREHIKTFTSPLGQKMLNSLGGPKDRLTSNLQNMQTAVKSFKGK